MTVRKQITLLMSALIVAFVALGLGARAWQERQTQSLAQNALHERETFVRRIAALQGRDLESYVRDTTFWDDLAQAAAKHNKAWGKENFADSLSSFRMTGVWAFDQNGAPAFSVRAPQISPACPISPDALRATLNDNTHFCHFFVQSGTGVLEVRGATIHRSADVARKGKVLGYLYAVRPWDAPALAELEALTDSRVSLVDAAPTPQERQSVATSDGALRFTFPVADWQGKPFAFLRFTAHSDAVRATHVSGNGSTLMFAGFTAGLLSLLFFCLVRWVSAPLAALSACLRREEPHTVAALVGARSEFGEIARLMQNFFVQQRALSDAHDQMEARVNERTIALVGVNIALKSELSERKRAEGEREQALTAWKESQQRFESLVRNASDMVTIIGTCGDLQYVSPASQRMLCAPPDALGGLSFFDLVHDDDRATFETLFRECAATPGINLTCEVRLRCAPQTVDGSETGDDNRKVEYCACEAILHNLVFEPGVNGIVATFHDITERKAFERELAHQAFHDVLTGLPNRALFMERLDHALERTRRRKSEKGSGLAVLFLDLDNFKYVNDSLGHEAGDRLLVGVTKRLQASVRPGDTVARQGGDEFTLLLEDIDGPDDARAIAAEVARALLLPFSVEGRDVFTTGSVGIAVSRDGSDLSENLLRDADTAMYQAKNHGKARWEVFDRTMNARVIERLEMETLLRRALEKNEFQVHYQPIVNLNTGRIVEVEALARWVHPERGLITPEQFVPLAEENGLIVPLGKWVLEQACAQACEWQKQFPFLEKTFTVGVNLSARQFQEADLVEQITNALSACGLSPACLKVEITETMMMNADATVDMLRRLRALGIRVAVDDFGTGYSSMSYLSSLPIDTLKIDKSFVARLGQNAEQEAIVRAVVTLGKALHLSVTGEGIETEEHRTRLRALGCDLGQGYLFSRPLAPVALAPLLAAQERFPAPLSAPPPPAAASRSVLLAA